MYNNTLSSIVEDDASLRPWKYVLTIVAFSTAVVGSYLPWRLTDPASATALVRHGTCLAAGFIIGGGFLHAYPEAIQLFAEWRIASGKADTTSGVVDLGCTGSLSHSHSPHVAAVFNYLRFEYFRQIRGRRLSPSSLCCC
jgi:hypothetical protein